MSWSIFGRLFWKVWREDWKRWASVLPLCLIVPLTYIKAVYNTNPDLLSTFSLRQIMKEGIAPDDNYFFLFLACYVCAAISAGRGRRDQAVCHHDRMTTNVSYQQTMLASMMLLTIWSVAFAFCSSVCLYIPREVPFLKMMLIMLLYVTPISLFGYALGHWLYPWFIGIIVAVPYPFIWGFAMECYEPKPDEHAHLFGLVTIVIWAITMATHLLTAMMSQRIRKRVPAIAQFTMVVLGVSGCILGLTYLISEGGATFGENRYSNGNFYASSKDWSLNTSFLDKNKLTLHDYRTNHIYEFFFRKHGNWDQVVPVGMTNNGFVTVIAINRALKSTDVVRWDFRHDRVSIITSLDLGQHSAAITIADDYQMTNDGNYLLMRLRSRVGFGSDYMVVNITARSKQIVLANAYSGYKMCTLDDSKSAIIDERNDTARILDLEKASLGPVIDWAEGDHTE